MSLGVPIEHAKVLEQAATHITDEWLLIRVCPLVEVPRAHLGESLATLATLVRTFASVCVRVDTQH